MSGISLAGQSVLLDPDSRIESMINARLRTIIWPSLKSQQRQSPTIPISRPGTTRDWFSIPYGDVPPPRVNEWIDPTGISRYGRGLFLAGKTAMYAIAAAAFGEFTVPGSGQPELWEVGYSPITLNFDYNDSTSSFDPSDSAVARSVYLISPMCLDAHRNNSLWLLPVVDERYLWLDLPVDIRRSDCESWDYLFQRIATRIGKTIDTVTADSSLGIPDIRAWSESRVSAGVALDIAAMSIGLRAALDADGEILLQDGGEAFIAIESLSEKGIRLGGISPEMATPENVAVQGPIILDYFDDSTTWEKESEPDKANASSDANAYNVYSTFAIHKINGNELSTSETARDSYVDKLGELLLAWRPVPQISIMPGIVFLADSTMIDYVSIHVSGTDDVHTSIVMLPHEFHPKASLCQWPDNYVHASPTAYFESAGSGFPDAVISLESSWYEGTPSESIELKLPPWIGVFDSTAENVIAYYQKETGWVIWAGDAKASRIQFLTAAKIVDRVVTAKVLWLSGSVAHPATGEPLAIGDELDIHDPSNLWGEIEENATGMAFLKSARGDDPDTSGVDEEHEARWEIESCTLPISEIRAKITGCLEKSDTSGTATFGEDPEDWIRSSYPNCDFPPEPEPDGPLSDTYEFTFQNSWKLDAGLNAYGIFRRITNVRTSEPENVVVPKERSATSAVWELVKVEEHRARNILVTRGAGSSWTVDDYWDGADPEACGTPNFACVFDCTCVKEGHKAKGTYDPEENVYRLESTASAMLGEPVEKTIIISDGFGFTGCSLGYSTITIQAFECPTADPVPLSTSIQTITFPVVTNAWLAADGLRASYGTVEVCSGTFSGSALLLPIQPCPVDPPPDCSGTATWQWSHDEQRWIETTPCPNGCTSNPPAIPSPEDRQDPDFDGASTSNTQPCGEIVGP